MSETVKDALWPMELGMAGSANLRKFKGEQKQQVDAALAKYGDKSLEKIHKLARGNVDSQFAAYDLANGLGLQLKGTSSARRRGRLPWHLKATRNSNLSWLPRRPTNDARKCLTARPVATRP